MSEILKVWLTIHIIGLATSGGGAITGYLNLKKIWSLYRLDANSNAAEPNRFLVLLSSRLHMWIGLALSIVSGAAMMRLAYGAFMDQLWFQVKLLAIVIIVIMEITRSIYVRRARKQISAQQGTSADLATLKSRVDLLSLIQLISFLVIFVLAVFRFDK